MYVPTYFKSMNASCLHNPFVMTFAKINRTIELKRLPVSIFSHTYRLYVGPIIQQCTHTYVDRENEKIGIDVLSLKFKINTYKHKYVHKKFVYNIFRKI